MASVPSQSQRHAHERRARGDGVSSGDALALAAGSRLGGTQRDREQWWRQPLCAAATLQRSDARGKCASANTEARA